jgi:hypothetical protein
MGVGTDCWTLGDCGALFQVNRSTGALSVLSDFGDLTQGPRGEDAGHSMVLDFDGSILVVDPYAASGVGALFRVSLIGSPAGARTLLTTGVGHDGDVVVGTDGFVLLSECATPALPSGLLVCRVDRTSGAKTVLSNFEDPAQGPTGIPLSIAVYRLADMIFRNGFDL